MAEMIFKGKEVVNRDVKAGDLLTFHSVPTGQDRVCRIVDTNYKTKDELFLVIFGGDNDGERYFTDNITFPHGMSKNEFVMRFRQFADNVQGIRVIEKENIKYTVEEI